MTDENKQQVTPTETKSNSSETINESPMSSEQKELETTDKTQNISSPTDTNPLESVVTESGLEDDSATETESENEAIISALQQENANLKKLLDEKKDRETGVKAQYARLSADFDNFRKRTLKEKENLTEQTKKSVINELLPVVDNFERARTQIQPATEGEQTIQNSYQGVYKTLVDCLKRLGVSAMRPEGEQFDPNFHEAMLREATNEHPDGTVIEQLMRGYMLGEQVLRHAMVKVAVPIEPVITSEEEQQTSENTAINDN